MTFIANNCDYLTASSLITHLIIKYVLPSNMAWCPSKFWLYIIFSVGDESGSSEIITICQISLVYTPLHLTLEAPPNRRLLCQPTIPWSHNATLAKRLFYFGLVWVSMLHHTCFEHWAGFAIFLRHLNSWDKLIISLAQEKNKLCNLVTTR